MSSFQQMMQSQCQMMMTQMNNSLEKVKKDQDALTMKLSQAETQETPTKEAEAPYVLDLTLLCATVKIPKSVILLKSFKSKTSKA